MFPQYILDWHPNNKQMSLYTPYAIDKVLWVCQFGHTYSMCISNKTRHNNDCPLCQSCPTCFLWKTHGKLCEYCKPINENKLYNKTKEMQVVKYLKENLPELDFIHNKSVGKDCTGNNLYPDIRFDCIFYHIIIEIDEFKHRGSSYKCDKERMYNIIAKLGLPCIFIRYNPDNKYSDITILLEVINKYLNLDIIKNINNYNIWDDFGYKCEYLFY
jgi:hypothetical protein